MIKPWLSILMAYHNRPELLRNTLESYLYFYKNRLDEFEIVIVDDSSSDHGILTRLLLEFPFTTVTQYIDRRDRECRNPCVIYNEAASIAQGEYYMITNPENFHMGDIIEHAKKNVRENYYIVYGCRTLSGGADSFEELRANLSDYINWEFLGGWYQHTSKRNRLLHFCSVIHSKDYDKIGGFSEEYVDGAGYDDDDFIAKVLDRGIRVGAFDDPFCAHQNHSRTQWTMDKTMYNLKIFASLWGRGPVVVFPKSVLDSDKYKYEAPDGALLFGEF